MWLNLRSLVNGRVPYPFRCERIYLESLLKLSTVSYSMGPGEFILSGLKRTSLLITANLTVLCLLSCDFPFLGVISRESYCPGAGASRNDNFLVLTSMVLGRCVKLILILVLT